MKRMNYLFLAFGLVILFNNQIVFSQESKPNFLQSNEKQCSAFIEGLEFCLESAFISLNSDTAVILHYSINNLTEQEIIIHGGRRGGSSLLHLIVTDEKGNIIPTIFETLTEKLKNEGLSKEESGKFIRFLSGSGPNSSDFEPNEKTKWSWNLSYLYEFKNKGRYFVEIYKKELKQSEKIRTQIFLGKIEIEIK